MIIYTIYISIYIYNIYIYTYRSLISLIIHILVYDIHDWRIVEMAAQCATVMLSSNMLHRLDRRRFLTAREPPIF